MTIRRVLLSALVLGLIATVAGAATWAAFSDTTGNPGNSFAAGTVTITDNDGGGTLLSLTNAVPSDTATGCIKVTYTGSLNANVRLFGSVTGALAPYLNLKVTRGTDSGSSFPGCGSFTADTRNYAGHGAGVIYNGTLDGFPASFAAGLIDPDNSNGDPETWTTSEVHAYKLEVTLQNDLAAQGKSANASFTWEARNQ